jgi:hypothetical protein
LKKQIEYRPPVARRFAKDMRAFHAEPNSIKRDEIAARQLHALRQHYSGKFRRRNADVCGDERSRLIVWIYVDPNVAQWSL